MGIKDIFQSGTVIYFVGIKGTGVCALAELMHNTGLKVSGSDISEVFYTDAILKDLNILYHENFDAAHISASIDIVVHSSAYSASSNPELARALELEIPVMKYTDALGNWSARFDSTGVCGVHGKTTTTAICGILMRAAGVPAQILTGSAA
ncbi:MAG: Mur ligase domain-containing protein, partial [Treponema sp.]|nr:Mur ligase domain-containing protein [Treponema sp.]